MMTYKVVGSIFEEITKEQFAQESKFGLSVSRAISCRQFDVPTERDLTFTVDEIVNQFLQTHFHADTISLSIFEPDGKRVAKYFKRFALKAIENIDSTEASENCNE